MCLKAVGGKNKGTKLVFVRRWKGRSLEGEIRSCSVRVGDRGGKRWEGRSIPSFRKWPAEDKRRKQEDRRSWSSQRWAQDLVPKTIGFRKRLQGNELGFTDLASWENDLSKNIQGHWLITWSFTIFTVRLLANRASRSFRDLLILIATVFFHFLFIWNCGALQKRPSGSVWSSLLAQPWGLLDIYLVGGKNKYLKQIQNMNMAKSVCLQLFWLSYHNETAS